MKAKNFLLLLMFETIVLHYSIGLPIPQNDNDISSYGNHMGSGMNSGGGGGVDYNTVMGHFKDLFMYFPVMMTTLKETMTGFPKFAEGLRILTSKSGRANDEDCKCSRASSNEIDNGN